SPSLAVNDKRSPIAGDPARTVARALIVPSVGVSTPRTWMSVSIEFFIFIVQAFCRYGFYGTETLSVAFLVRPEQELHLRSQGRTGTPRHIEQRCAPTDSASVCVVSGTG